MLSVDISLLVVFIVVWVLVIVLTRYFFKPYLRVMRERDEGIQKDRRTGESCAGEVEEILCRIESEVKQARGDALAIRQSLEAEALAKKERVLGEISRECREQVAKARDELERQVEGLKTELKAESEQMAEHIEKRLLN